MADGRIYVGNLPMDVQERDIEDLFFKYGKIRDIELKNNRGTIPFAFVRFEDPRWVPGLMLSFSPSLTEDREHGGSISQKSLNRKKVRSNLLFSHRDAEDAVYGRNGYGFGDCKLRVEYPRSSGSKFGGSGSGPRGRFGPPSRRSEFRVIVTGRSKHPVSPVCHLFSARILHIAHSNTNHRVRCTSLTGIHRSCSCCFRPSSHWELARP